MLLFRLEREVIVIEHEHNVSKRWEISDVEYQEVESSVTKEKQLQIVVAMWSTVVRRQMLLHLKAKYAGK